MPAFADKGFQNQYVSITKFEARRRRTISTQKAMRRELVRVHKIHFAMSIGKMFPEVAHAGLMSP